MRKLRKAISFVLVFAMLFSISAFSETTVTLKDISSDTVVGKAVTELVKLNIINGYEDNTFRPDNTITRGEFAKIVTTFLNIAHLGSDTMSSGFEDVDGINHWAKKYIKLAVDKKIVKGYDDGTFRPDDPVKYVEAVKMLVCALNYGIIAENKMTEGSPWYQGYLAVATERGILNNASVNNFEDPASRGTVAVLTYNCLEVPPAEVSSSGTVTIGTGSAIKDIIGKEQITGVVTAVYQTGLTTGAPGVAKRNIIVKTPSEELLLKTPKDYDNYSLLGYKISGYVEDGEFDEADNISQISREKQNKLTVVTPEMFDDFTTSGISYYPDENSGSTRKLSFDSKMSVIYNGKYLANWTVEDFENVKSGKIELLCNDGDNDIEVAFITSYELFVVSSIITRTPPVKISSMYGANDLTIPDKDNSGYIYSVTKGGVDFDPTTLTKWDVVSVLRSKDSAEGKAVFTAVVTRTKMAGKLIETSDNVIKIESKEYKFAYNFSEYSGVNKPDFNSLRGLQVTVYLDHEGKIAAAENTSQDSSIYIGYVVNAEKENGIDGAARIRIFGVTGATGERIYKLASKTRIDGVIISDYSQMITKLQETSASVNKGKKVDTSLSPTEYSQLIRYTLNAKGEMDMIDTSTGNSTVTSDDLTKSITSYPDDYKSGDLAIKHKYVSGGKFISSNGSTLIQADGTTKVIVVPNDMSDISLYSTKAYSSVFSNDEGYKIEAYNLNSVKVAKYILVFKGDTENTFNEASPFAITKDVASFNGNDGVQDKVTGWSITGAAVTDLLSETGGMLIGKYEAGEIFRYFTNSDNEIKETQTILDIENSKPVLRYGGTADLLAPVSTSEEAFTKRTEMYDNYVKASSDSRNRFYYGTVLGKEGNVISVTPLLATDSIRVTDGHEENFTITTSTKVFFYDLTTSRIENRIEENASLDNIKSVAQLEEGSKDISGASQVLIYTQYNSVKSIIIFKTTEWSYAN